MNATAAPASGTNRRFIMLALVLGILGAILLYTAVSRDSGSGPSAGGGQIVPVVVARTEIPARTRITASMVEVRMVPEGARSFMAYTRAEEVIGQVTRFPVAANEHLLPSKLVALDGTATGRALTYVVPPGKRAFAIRVSEVQTAGGLILPGDYVDVIVIYDMEFVRGTNVENASSYFVQTLFQNVEVLAVSQAVVDLVMGQETTPNGQRARNSDGRPNPDASTVTLALTPEEVQKIYLAESNGRIRLALRPFGDGEVRPIDPAIRNELYPRDIPNPFLQR